MALILYAENADESKAMRTLLLLSAFLVSAVESQAQVPTSAPEFCSLDLVSDPPTIAAEKLGQGGIISNEEKLREMAILREELVPILRQDREARSPDEIKSANEKLRDLRKKYAGRAFSTQVLDALRENQGYADLARTFNFFYPDGTILYGMEMEFARYELHRQGQFLQYWNYSKDPLRTLPYIKDKDFEEYIDRPGALESLPQELRDELTRGLNLDDNFSMIQGNPSGQLKAPPPTKTATRTGKTTEPTTYIVNLGPSEENQARILIPGENSHSRAGSQGTMELQIDPARVARIRAARLRKDRETLRQRWLSLPREKMHEVIDVNLLSGEAKARIYVRGKISWRFEPTKSPPELRNLLGGLAIYPDPMGSTEVSHLLPHTDLDAYVRDLRQLAALTNTRFPAGDVASRQKWGAQAITHHWHVSKSGSNLRPMATALNDLILLRSLALDMTADQVVEKAFGYSKDIQNRGFVRMLNDSHFEVRHFVDHPEKFAREVTAWIQMPEAKALAEIGKEISGHLQNPAIQAKLKARQMSYYGKWIQNPHFRRELENWSLSDVHQMGRAGRQEFLKDYHAVLDTHTAGSMEVDTPELRKKVFEAYKLEPDLAFNRYNQLKVPEMKHRPELARFFTHAAAEGDRAALGIFIDDYGTNEEDWPAIIAKIRKSLLSGDEDMLEIALDRDEILSRLDPEIIEEVGVKLAKRSLLVPSKTPTPEVARRIQNSRKLLLEFPDLLESDKVREILTKGADDGNIWLLESLANKPSLLHAFTANENDLIASAYPKLASSKDLSVHLAIWRNSSISSALTAQAQERSAAYVLERANSGDQFAKGITLLKDFPAGGRPASTAQMLGSAFSTAARQFHNPIPPPPAATPATPALNFDDYVMCSMLFREISRTRR